MKFDFTKNVALEPQWQKRYSYSRLVLYLLAVCAGIYAIYLILFPSQLFSFDFSNPNSNKNTIFNVSGGAGLLTSDIFSPENFSRAGITLSPNTKKLNFSNNTVKIRKTYKAFAYPESAQPAVFPDGSLLQNNGGYYIISDGALRKFSSLAVAQELGYASRSFTGVTADELTYNKKGGNITNGASYPDGSLFSIDNNYYQLQNGNALVPFLSGNAFKSRYSQTAAIVKDSSFLSGYQTSQNQIGFADGTLLSFGGTVFVVSGNTVRAFDNPNTFLALGYSWSNIIPSGEDEISFYQYQHAQLFTMNDPHPNGTVFSDSATGKYYLIENNQKEEIKGADILKAYTRSSAPIMVDSRSLNFDSCRLKKSFSLFSSEYHCSIPVANLASFPGNYYQLEMAGTVGNTLSEISADFSRDINWSNMRDTLSGIKHNILAKFGHANSN